MKLPIGTLLLMALGVTGCAGMLSGELDIFKIGQARTLPPGGVLKQGVSARGANGKVVRISTGLAQAELAGLLGAPSSVQPRGTSAESWTFHRDLAAPPLNLSLATSSPYPALTLDTAQKNIGLSQAESSQQGDVYEIILLPIGTDLPSALIYRAQIVVVYNMDGRVSTIKITKRG